MQVVGTLTPVRNDDRTVDVAATMAGAPALVAAGVTDVRVALRVTDDGDAAFDTYAAAAEAFRDAVGGP